MINKSFLMASGIAVLCPIFLMGPPSCAATCGAKEVRDIIESQSLEAIKLAKSQLESSGSASKYGESMLRIYNQIPVFSSSHNFQVGEEDDIKHCKGQLTISLPGGANTSVMMSYDLISTEDGNIIINQQSIAHESPAEAVAQYLMAFTTPNAPNAGQ